MTENGEHRGAARAAIDVIGGLPTAFKGLITLNAVFVGATFWLLKEIMSQRAELVLKLLEACQQTRK